MLMLGGGGMLMLGGGRELRGGRGRELWEGTYQGWAFAMPLGCGPPHMALCCVAQETTFKALVGLAHTPMEEEARARGRGRGDYFLTSHSIFYGMVGQIALFSHGQT